MLRKIRRFYWKQRDRGLGRQTVMAAVGAALFLMIILGAVTKNVIMPKNESQKNVARTETASGTAIGAEPASGGGVAIENIETGFGGDVYYYTQVDWRDLEGGFEQYQLKAEITDNYGRVYSSEFFR